METDAKIEKINDNLVITVPMKSRRMNPWEDSPGEEMDNIIGLIESDMDMGLCYRIDMDYKGKPDQWTDYFYKWNGSQKEFEILCTQLLIDVVKM
ncbi:MAG: hypothetical protein KBC33_00030 [Candidatus Pacebacteria bacterium]|nr:hypothetical protein [Candidatus Paceibacterota bacterium]